jgi:hypothetical protein
MSIKIEVRDKNIIADLKKITKNIRQSIEQGLDNSLDKDLDILKAELKSIINSNINLKVVKEEDPHKSTINIAKSDAEIINQITKRDLSKIKTTKDYSEMVNSGITIIADRKNLKNKGLDATSSVMSSGANLRLPMSAESTFENQMQLAINHFNNSIFILEENGKLYYYMNPGIDLSKYVKIVCSRDTGDTERSRKKFNLYKNGRSSGSRGQAKDHADWTLLKDGIDVIKTKFIRLDTIIDDIKDSKYEDAIETINKKNLSNSKVQDIKEEIDNIKSKSNLLPTTKSYSNIITLINSLKIRKRISNYKTSYTLFSVDIENSKEEEDFITAIKREIYLWKISNENHWIDVIIKAVNRSLKG